MDKRTILVAVGFACSVVVSGNVVPNSGFEEVNADGSLKGIRNTGNLFRRDPSGGVGGSAALMYENADPKANRILPAMPLPLNPGKAYSISFKVRCENLTGGRASFCLEWPRRKVGQRCVWAEAYYRHNRLDHNGGGHSSSGEGTQELPFLSWRLEGVCRQGMV